MQNIGIKAESALKAKRDEMWERGSFARLQLHHRIHF
jgi:hypothetical protein